VWHATYYHATYISLHNCITPSSLKCPYLPAMGAQSTLIPTNWNIRRIIKQKAENLQSMTKSIIKECKPLAERPRSCQLQLHLRTLSKHLLFSPSALPRLLPSPQQQTLPPHLSSNSNMQCYSNGRAQLYHSSQQWRLSSVKTESKYNEKYQAKTTNSVLKLSNLNSFSWRLCLQHNTVSALKTPSQNT